MIEDYHRKGTISIRNIHSSIHFYAVRCVGENMTSVCSVTDKRAFNSNLARFVISLAQILNKRRILIISIIDRI